MDKIIRHTEEDATLQELKKAILRGYINKSDQKLSAFRKVFEQITISDEGLMLKGDKIILPSKLINRALEKAHQGGHPGMSCMKRRIRSHFWFPKMDHHTEEFVKSCKNCVIFTNKTTRSPLHHHTTKQDAWENVNIDLFGPMPDNKHILVVTDSMSRFPAAKIVPSKARPWEASTLTSDSRRHIAQTMDHLSTLRHLTTSQTRQV
jgi:hypothetical protein